jgi:hypothetical protein
LLHAAIQGLNRKRDGLGLHGGVDRDPLEVPRRSAPANCTSSCFIWMI